MGIYWLLRFSVISRRFRLSFFCDRVYSRTRKPKKILLTLFLDMKIFPSIAWSICFLVWLNTWQLSKIFRDFRWCCGIGLSFLNFVKKDQKLHAITRLSSYLSKNKLRLIIIAFFGPVLLSFSTCLDVPQ